MFSAIPVPCISIALAFTTHKTLEQTSIGIIMRIKIFVLRMSLKNFSKSIRFVRYFWLDHFWVIKEGFFVDWKEIQQPDLGHESIVLYVISDETSKSIAW